MSVKRNTGPFAPNRRLAAGVAAFALLLALPIAALADDPVSRNPSSVSFGSEAVGTTSSAQSVTFKNSSTTTPAVLGNASLTGTNSDQFSISSDTCSGATLPAHGSCVVKVKFSPTSVGPKAGTLRIENQTSSNNLNVDLSGTGVTASGSLSFSPTSLDFSSQQVQNTSATHTTTITNNGGSSVAFGAAALGGNNPGDFSIVSDTCSSSNVGPGNSCAIGVAFRPSTTGARSASLVVNDDVAGSPQQVGLSGTGTEAAATGGRAPTAAFTASPNPALRGQTVHFDASGSTDPDGSVVQYEWDLDGNGTFETNTGTSSSASHVYRSAGNVRVGLRVTDNSGQTDTTSNGLTISGPPHIGIRTPERLRLSTLFARGLRVRVKSNVAGRAVIRLIFGTQRVGTAGPVSVRADVARFLTLRLTRAGKRMIERSRQPKIKLTLRIVLTDRAGHRMVQSNHVKPTKG